MAARVVMKQSYSNWSDIPHAALGKMVEGQAWFTGSIKYQWSEKEWVSKGRTDGFENIDIMADVLGTEVHVKVGWDATYGFDVSVIRPTVSEKWHTRFGGRKHFYSNNYAGALSRIVSAIEAVTPECERLKEMNERAETERKLKEKQRNDVAELLGVELVDDDYGHGMKYRPSKNYSITFRRNDDGTLQMCGFEGKFIIEEVKRILDVVQTSPKVMADRLTKGK